MLDILSAGGCTFFYLGCCVVCQCFFFPPKFTFIKKIYDFFCFTEFNVIANNSKLGPIAERASTVGVGLQQLFRLLSAKRPALVRPQSTVDSSNLTGPRNLFLLLFFTRERQRCASGIPPPPPLTETADGVKLQQDHVTGHVQAGVNSLNGNLYLDKRTAILYESLLLLIYIYMCVWMYFSLLSLSGIWTKIHRSIFMYMIIAQ